MGDNNNLPHLGGMEQVIYKYFKKIKQNQQKLGAVRWF
jgi:hypothetical protein